MTARRLPVLARFPGLDAEGFGTVDVHAAVPYDARGTIWDPYVGIVAPQRPPGGLPCEPVKLARGYAALEARRCPP